MNDPASLTEHVAKIIFDDEDPEGSWERIEDWYEGRLSEQERDEKRKTAKTVLDYVTPLIRAAALEEVSGMLNHADLCRLSRLFNEQANLGLSQDMRINEWLKTAISQQSQWKMP